MDYYAHGKTPITKRYTAATANRVAVWTPQASARIVLTDCSVSAAIGGTMRIEFGTSNGYIVMDHMLQGSAMAYPFTSTYIDSIQADCPVVISFSAGTVQSNEATYVLLLGFEDRT